MLVVSSEIHLIGFLYKNYLHCGSNRNKIVLNSAVLQEGETINYKWVTKEELLGIFWNRKR